MLLHELAKVFSWLQESERVFYDPTDFAKSYNMRVDIQQDADEFFSLLCDQIEHALKDTQQVRILIDLFTFLNCVRVIHLIRFCRDICCRISLEGSYNILLCVERIRHIDLSRVRLFFACLWTSKTHVRCLKHFIPFFKRNNSVITTVRSVARKWQRRSTAS